MIVVNISYTNLNQIQTTQLMRFGHLSVTGDEGYTE